MARFRIFDAAPDYQFWAAMPAPVDPAFVTGMTSNSFSFLFANSGNYAGWTMTAEGTGFTYLDNGSGVLEPTGGRVTSITIRDGTNNVVFVVDQFPSAQRPELTDIYTLMFDTGGDWSWGLNMWDLLTVLNNYNDTIIGSEESDNIFAGRNLGNDTIMAMGGHDYVKGDAGKDTIDGGDGFDTLSYTESFYDYTAYRGINLNVATGKVTDCWGFVDTFSNFERYQGSRLRDVMNGSDADREEFVGFRGADVINGKGGTRDIVRYDDDENYGGKRGIICNLDDGSGTNGDIKGTIRDGFGHLDTILNIERVFGTNFNDRFVGSAADNVFLGKDGVDTFNGRGGWDRVDFWDAPNAININMMLASGQVINDGFGNTENLTNIEAIIGSDLADIIRGNNSDNEIEGGLGADTLRGNGGADRFHFFDISEFGDSILDFTTGLDKVAMDGSASGISTNWEFVASAAAVASTESTFYMSGRDLMLDIDGTGSEAAIFVVRIQVGGTLAAGDIDVYF